MTAPELAAAMAALATEMHAAADGATTAGDHVAAAIMHEYASRIRLAIGPDAVREDGEASEADLRERAGGVVYEIAPCDCCHLWHESLKALAEEFGNRAAGMRDGAAKTVVGGPRSPEVAAWNAENATWREAESMVRKELEF